MTERRARSAGPEERAHQIEDLSPLHQLTLRKRSIAVGTPITERPPHRSVRAELPHTAPTSGV